ncbi:MAG: hypothetical protein D6784_04720 [Chloroflexi bacterium]|nr:MAG: hypothetical protein D6784_04720 [Chloroflexota bacterium]
MTTRPIALSPTEAQTLVRCPLHFHFLLQSPPEPPDLLDAAVRSAVRRLHAAGGPARLPLDDLLQPLDLPAARQMVTRYYHRLEQDWPRLIAATEPMELPIKLGGILVHFHEVIDRVDFTSDGGILTIIFHTGPGPLPDPEDLRRSPAIAVYHALTAATYPTRRPVRIQKWWLALDQTVTVELSREEYLQHLADLRQAVHALVRGEVVARPGLHCEQCPFQYDGCPVYGPDSPDFDPDAPRGKIPPRQWIFRLGD